MSLPDVGSIVVLGKTYPEEQKGVPFVIGIVCARYRKVPNQREFVDIFWAGGPRCESGKAKQFDSAYFRDDPDVTVIR